MAKQKYPHKTNTILVDSSSYEAANEIEHALGGVIQKEQYIPQPHPGVLKTNTIYQPQVYPLLLPPSPLITLETFLSQLYPRKFKKAKEGNMQWCETANKRKKLRHVWKEAILYLRSFVCWQIMIPYLH